MSWLTTLRHKIRIEIKVISTYLEFCLPIVWYKSLQYIAGQILVGVEAILEYNGIGRGDQVFNGSYYMVFMKRSEVSNHGNIETLKFDLVARLCATIGAMGINRLL
ncbi:hypothetical protein PM082_017648 [Marasmius tenuissimus]|nr:hypothetical protein PM082_017648 [Marasmius tenuissimus]